MIHAHIPLARLAAALLAVCAAEALAIPVTLKEQNSDGTSLCAGCTASQGVEVQLTASSSAGYCGYSNYQLEFEVRKTADAWTNTPNHTSPVIPSRPTCVDQQYAWTWISGLLPNTAYKWQVRERYSGNLTGWYLFNGGSTGFVTGSPVTNNMVFTSSAQTIADNTCSAQVAVQRRDGANNPLPVGSASAVTLGDSQGIVLFYSDVACTTQVTQVTMAAGSSTATFYWKSPQPVTHTIMADMSDANWAELANNIVTPGPASKLTFINNTNTDYVNACSSAKSVQVQDASGYGINNTSTTYNITLSAGVPVTFYTNSTCTTPATAVVIGPGINSATFYSKSSTLGAGYWYASYTGLTQAQTYEYTYGRMAFTSAAQTITAGDCAPLPAVFQLQDGNNAVYTAAASTVLSLGGSSGFTFFSDATCTTAITSVTVPAGGTGGQYYWRGTTAGSVYIYVQGSYYDWTYQYQTVNAGPPSQIAFTTSAATVTAGACSPQANLAIQDVYGNASNITGATAVVISLSGSLSGTTFYSDAACTLGITGVSVQPGRNTASFYWKGITPGSDVLTATGDLRGTGTNTSGTQTETVRPKLAFTSTALNLPAGTCSPAIVLQSQDGAGGAWPATAATNINLSTTSGAGQFFSNLSCTSSITGITLPLSSSSVNVYYKDTRAGSPALSASASGYAGASQGETILPGTPYQLAFSSTAQVVGRTLCSAATTLVLQDQYGNNTTNTVARTINLSSSSAAMIFTSDAACGTQLPSSQITLPANAASVSFYFSDGNQGLPIITASCGGLLSANQTETITLGAATKLAYYTNGAQTLAAGACSQQVTVQSQSANGTPQAVLGDVAVALGSTSAGASFYSGVGCTGSVTSVTIPNGGISANFYWKDTTAGTPTLTASTSGLQSATAQQTVNAAAASRLAFVTAEQSVNAGRCSAVTTVRLADAYDNNATQGVATVVTPSSTSTGATFYSDAACSFPLTTVNIPAGSSSASFYWIDSMRGLPTITVATSGGITSASQLERVGGRDQAAYRWYSSAGAALAPESAAAEVQAGAQVHLRLGVLADSYTWKTAASDVSVQAETQANFELVVGTSANTYALDGVTETLTEKKLGSGPSAYRTLGDPGAAGSIDHAYHFPSIPSGRAAYDVCLAAKTTGEPLNVGWSATAGVITTPAFPGWQITSTAVTEVCFDLKGQGFAGGPLTLYLRDAYRSSSNDPTTADTFTMDQVYVRGDLPAHVALERATSPTFTGAVQVAAAELWNDAAHTDGARLSRWLTGTTLDETFVEARPSIPTNQQDVASGQQAEWDFAVTLPTGGGTYYYRLVITDAAGSKTGNLESVSAPARADTAATQLVFTTSAQSLAAGSCSAVATVERRDPAGNARPPRARSRWRSPPPAR